MGVALNLKLYKESVLLDQHNVFKNMYHLLLLFTLLISELRL